MGFLVFVFVSANRQKMIRLEKTKNERLDDPASFVRVRNESSLLPGHKERMCHHCETVERDYFDNLSRIRKAKKLLKQAVQLIEEIPDELGLRIKEAKKQSISALTKLRRAFG